MYARLVMRIALIMVMSAATGCGAGAASARRTTPARAVASAADAELEQARARADAAAERVVELESVLAMSQADVRALRAELADARHEQRTRTVRIGTPPVTHDDASADLPADFEREPSREAAAVRPVLRLYGEPRSEAPSPFVALASPAPRVTAAQASAPRLSAPPLALFDRLPVVAGSENDLPTVAAVTAAAPLGSVVAPRAPSESQRTSAAAVDEYRRALGLLHSRRFDEAVAALGDFLARYPGHAYADNATFWRGEAFYAQRAYPRAAAEFETVVTRFPEGNKVADALLKLGLCHAHMGDRTAAHAYFERVQREFPGTDAARIASREDAS